MAVTHKVTAILSLSHTIIHTIPRANGKTLLQEEQQHLLDLLDILKSKFGIDIHFQKDRNSEIRGYGIMSIRLFDGSEHSRKMSPRQSAWYFNSFESEGDVVAIRIAATMFSTEIFESVLLRNPVSDISSRI